MVVVVTIPDTFIVDESSSMSFVEAAHNPMPFLEAAQSPMTNILCPDLLNKIDIDALLPSMNETASFLEEEFFPTVSKATSLLGEEFLKLFNNVYTLERAIFLFQLVFFVGVCFNYSKILSFFGMTKQGKQTSSTKAMIASMTTSCAAFSMIVTSTTPISRVLYKKWLGTHGFAHLHAAVTDFKMEDGYYDYHVEPSTAVDYSWACHAIFGLLWVLSGCMAMRSGANNVSKHKGYWGRIALVSYVLHTTFALTTLYLNHAGHLMMNRLALFLNVLESSCHMAAAFKALFSKDKNKIDVHMKHMFLSYIISTEGAGQIRFVAIVNKILGRSVQDFCPSKNYHFNSSCAWRYVERLALIRFTSKFIIALYCYRNEEDRDMWSYVKQGLIVNSGVVLFIWTLAYFDASRIMAGLCLFQAFDFICGFYYIIKNGVDQEKPLGIPSFLW